MIVVWWQLRWVRVMAALGYGWQGAHRRPRPSTSPHYTEHQDLFGARVVVHVWARLQTHGTATEPTVHVISHHPP